MKIFKENSYDVVRLIINQVGISIFALVLYTSMGFIGENNKELASTLQVAFSAFSVVFFYALIYNLVWEIGAKDAIQIENGKSSLFRSKGLVLALLASVPNLVVCILTLVTKVIYLFSGVEEFNTAFFLFNLIMRFMLSMYIGVISAITTLLMSLINASGLITNKGIDIYLLQSIAYIIIPLLSLAVCQVAYTFGVKNIKLFAKTRR